MKHTRCSKDRNILLLLDNHESFISIEVLNYVKKNGIITTEDDDDSVGFDLLICEDKKSQINEYVVMKSETKKKILYFVGIVEGVKDDEIEINFLKKCNGEKGFVFPDKEYRGSYSYEDICLILPSPNPVGGTYRCARKLVFSYDLSIYVGL